MKRETEDPGKPQVELNRAEWIAVFTLLVIFAQSCVNYWTLSEIKKTTTATQTAANAAQTQANVSLSQTNAIERSANAAQTQANASTIQANVSEQMVKQNERLVKAGETQANTSQVSTRLAAQSAEITKETLRPIGMIEVSMGSLTDEEMIFSTKIRNDGGTLTRITFRYCLMRDTAPNIHTFSQCDPAKTATKGPFPIPPHNFQMVHIRIAKPVLQAARARKIYLYLLNEITYEDFGQLRVTPFCWVYREDFKTIGDCQDLVEPANQNPEENKNPK